MFQKPLKKVLIEEAGSLIQTVDVPGTTAAVATPECNPAGLARAAATAGTALKDSSRGELVPSSGVPKAKVLRIEEIGDTSALQ